MTTDILTEIIAHILPVEHQRMRHVFGPQYATIVYRRHGIAGVIMTETGHAHKHIHSGQSIQPGRYESGISVFPSVEPVHGMEITAIKSVEQNHDKPVSPVVKRVEYSFHTAESLCRIMAAEQGAARIGQHGRLVTVLPRGKAGKRVMIVAEPLEKTPQQGMNPVYPAREKKHARQLKQKQRSEDIMHAGHKKAGN